MKFPEYMLPIWISNDNPKDEYFRYQDAETKKYCAELWTKVKAQ